MCVCVSVRLVTAIIRFLFFLSKMMKNLIQKLIAALCFVSKWLVPLEASFFSNFAWLQLYKSMGANSICGVKLYARIVWNMLLLCINHWDWMSVYVYVIVCAWNICGLCGCNIICGTTMFICIIFLFPINVVKPNISWSNTSLLFFFSCFCIRIDKYNIWYQTKSQFTLIHQ